MLCPSTAGYCSSGLFPTSPVCRACVLAPQSCAQEMAPQGIFSLMLRACFLGVGPEQLLAFHAQKGQCLFKCCAITILTFLIILFLTCVLQQKRGAHLCVHHFFLPHSCILFMMSQTTTFVWTLHVSVGVMGDLK